MRINDKLHHLLEWYATMGIDTVVADQPFPWFKQGTNTVKELGKSQEVFTLSHSKDSYMAPRKSITSLLQDSLTEPSLSECQDLNQLRQALETFEGCALKQTATNMVFGDGVPSEVMLVGEAPGADEDRQGKPFVGISGQLLTKMMASIGLSRENYYITNIIPWRPPGNRPPTAQEIIACLPFIRRHIELVNPKILVMVGGISAKTLLATNEGIMKLRGQWHSYHSSGLAAPIKALATFHPAYLLRSPGQKAASWKDLLLIQQALKEKT